MEKHQHKAIKSFSSGMKQRVKLITTLMSDCEIIILDEPTTNLDIKGVDWYLSLVEKVRNNKLIITGSNLEREYSFCNHVMNIADYKIGL
ncbi:MAG: ATP-binding cassette domain-containing protein [Bacteroidetes bacterium]|nr:ATP-binding cassette domain-containing protein [Bacteroidota bacterium]